MSRDYVESIGVRYAGWDGVNHAVVRDVHVYMGEVTGRTYRTACLALVFGPRPLKVDITTDDVSCMSCMAREPG